MQGSNPNPLEKAQSSWFSRSIWDHSSDLLVLGPSNLPHHRIPPPPIPPKPVCRFGCLSLRLRRARGSSVGTASATLGSTTCQAMRHPRRAMVWVGRTSIKGRPARVCVWLNIGRPTCPGGFPRTSWGPTQLDDPSGSGGGRAESRGGTCPGQHQGDVRQTGECLANSTASPAVWLTSLQGNRFHKQFPSIL